MRQAIHVKRRHTRLRLRPPTLVHIGRRLIETAAGEDPAPLMVIAVFHRVIEQGPVRIKQRIIRYARRIAGVVQQPDVLQIMPVGNAGVAVSQDWLPIARILVRASAQPFAQHRAALDFNQLQQPLPGQGRLARPVIRRQGLQQMQVRVHQLAVRLAHVSVPLRPGRPILVEPFQITPVNLVVRLGLQNVEKLIRQIQRLLFARSQIILGQPVQSEGLPVKMLAAHELVLTRDIHLPVEPAILLVPHLVLQKSKSRIRRRQIFLPAVPLPRVMRIKPHHPALRHNHLKWRPGLEFSLYVMIENVAPVLLIHRFWVPEPHDILRQIRLNPWPVNRRHPRQILPGNRHRREKEQTSQQAGYRMDGQVETKHVFSVDGCFHVWMGVQSGCILTKTALAAN